MAMAVGEEDVLPITIPEALDSLARVIVDIIRKNRTMVEYYIYPKETPSEIEAYRPRLQVLYTRLESLSALDLAQLTLLVDDAAALMSAFLLPIIDQLLNAVHGVQQIFINHYDRDLEDRKPYNGIYTTLEYREKQLKKFQADQMRNPQRRLPETVIPIPPNPTEPSFCRFAVAYTNHRDHGKLAQVMSEDLTSEDREKLRNTGGAYLSWDCPGCAFKLKYHVLSSMTSSMQMTDDVRSHSSVPEVEYRPTWLVKCHVYQAKSRNGRDSLLWDDRRESVMDSRRGSTIRRQSDARSSRTSNPFFFGGPRRSKSEIVTDKYATLNTTSRESKAKYGCPFCFVTGRPYGHMDYRNGRELAEHIAARHHLGLSGRCADNVRRWDLNIR
ncbi:hypothetical protein LTR70_004453 [Exophiala xenobiotica]|nr:hypothetical protein LTR70_004453 [Exophiala xenobiotica]